MRFVFILCSLLVAMHTFAAPADSVRAEQREEGLFVVHKVEEKETLYSIAKRYGGSVIGIINHNQIIDNRIEIGQLLYVLVEKEKSIQAEVLAEVSDDVHVVMMGETLYSISRKYDLKLKDLKKWNGLSSNDISPGMRLKLSKKAKIKEPEVVKVPASKTNEDIEESNVEDVDPFAEFEKYLVQTGETLSTIANKIGVSIDSLKLWNELETDFLRIGQELSFKKAKKIKIGVNEPKKKKRTQIDENGFERVYEEGIASVIQSMNTSRYLALHRKLPIGTSLKVRNLMNNQVVHVKVVGKLPNTGVNKNILLRLSQPAYDQLGILDSKSRVEVSFARQ